VVVGSVEDQCKMQMTNTIERKYGVAWPQTAKTEPITGMWLSWYAVKKASQGGLAEVEVKR